MNSLETCTSPTDQNTRNMLRDLRKGVMQEEQYCDPSLRQIQIHGDSALGTIIHFGQIHAIIDEKGENCASPEMEKRVIEGQKRIYETLKQERPDFIFLEALSGGEEQGISVLVQSIFDDTLYAMIQNSGKEKAVFDAFSVSSREEIKEKLFYLFGGGAIYGALEHRPILGAETREKNAGAFSALKEISKTDAWTCINIYNAALKERIAPEEPNTPNAILEVREKEALNRIKKVLEEYPGKKVALIYGEGHNFSHQYYPVFGSHGPILERHDFPVISTGALSLSLEETLSPYGKPIFYPGK